LKLAIATCARFPYLADDDAVLPGAFAARGVETSVVVWNDPGVDWSRFDAVVVRSTWDYHLDLPVFFTWLDRIERGARVVNAPATMRWNAHKGYLRGLAERGIDIVPTIFLSQGNRPDFEEIAAELGAPEFVIKPAVSASAFRTTVIGRGYEPREAAAGILDMLVRDRDAMVQPFMREIFAFGERSLVFIAGTFSHAIRRTPIAHGEAGAETSNARIDIPAEQHDFAQRVLATLDHVPAYARVDIVPVAAGGPLLSELELIEPSLYFRHCPPCAAAFADAVLDAIATPALASDRLLTAGSRA
jgi:glutathione synthase/RimK-type ligase-like ATP-grasp enzyme